MIGLGGRAMAFGGAFGSDARRFEIAARSPGGRAKSKIPCHCDQGGKCKATPVKLTPIPTLLEIPPFSPPFFASGSRPRQLALIPTLSNDADSDARGLASRDCARRLLSRK